VPRPAFAQRRRAPDANDTHPAPAPTPPREITEATMTARAALSAVLLLLASSANAISIDALGNTFTVDFDGNVETQPVPGLSAQATFLVTEFDGAAGRVTLEISLANTADASIWKSARISAIGFDVDAPLADAEAGGLFSHAVLGGKFPNQFGPVDVCAIDNAHNCSGGRWGGVKLGKSGVLTLTLQFDGPIAALDLTNFGVRYQSLTSKSLELCDASGTGRGTVPEPRALALLGAAGLAFWGRKRRA
jgi:hypothetical protein